MWRHQSFTEIHDSDQSISDGDGEEQELNCPENYVSLAETSAHQENLGIASRLELLKGFHQKDLGFSSEDDVEVPDFHKRVLDSKNIRCDPISSKADDSTSDTDEWVSGVKQERKMFVESIRVGDSSFEGCDLYTKEDGKQFERCTSSAVHKESGKLDHLAENARSSMVYSKIKTPGGRCKAKRRSSCQLQPHKQVVSWSVWKDMDPNPASDDELLEEAEASEFQPPDKTSPVLLGDADGETLKSSLALPMEAVIQQDQHRHSMAELLDNLRGKIRNPHLKSKKGRRTRGHVQHSVIRSMSLSDKNIMSDEDPCELTYGESSTHNEDNAKNLEITVVEPRKKTMADKFQEAFGCASVDNRRPAFVLPKHSSTGLFGRLQNIMQGQKEQDAEFLRKVQTEVWPEDGARCIDVKILSRSFDAKLSVCHCSQLENEQSSLQNPQQENFGKIWTVIFRARVCGDVDLEVGNLIRIFPPWKEVQVLRGGEIIILTSYFSQVHT